MTKHNAHKINIVIVDDHQLVRDGLRAILSENEEINILDEAEDYNTLKKVLKQNIPDVILMDISLPETSGIDITKEITAQYPEIKLLMLSMYTQEDFIFNAISAGAKGYLPKNATREELINGIKAVNAGKTYFSKQITDMMLESIVNQKQQKILAEENKETTPLSQREIEILKLVVEGLNNQEIADRLFISIRTVESHKNHIMQKLNLKTTVEMVKYAIRNNIVDKI